MKIIKTANGNQVKMSKSEWETIGKTAGWVEDRLDMPTQENVVERVSRGPFTAQGLINRAFRNGFIAIKDVMTQSTKDAAESVAESFSDWSDDQGFGSSDYYAAIQNFLQSANLPMPTEEEREHNRVMAQKMSEMFGV